MNAIILKPLLRMIKTIEESDHEGVPSEYLEEANSKELDTLTKAMNKMIASIRKSRERLKEQERNLVFQAHHDPLTGLPNRLLFQDRLTQGLKKADREKKRLAVFFIDLDHFKEVNDSYGHETGDILLQNIAQRLQGVIRAHDTLARLGGDEFTIIMENLGDSVDISNLAQKILNSLSSPVVVNGTILYVSSSIGISLYPNDANSVQDLLKYADTAMYKAKDEGRNNFQFYNAQLTQLALDRVVLEVSLREALRKGEFVVYFQPQIDTELGEICGMEALVRWQHPEKGLIFPDAFIPLAESTGLIVELDRYVMKVAMEQVFNWREQGLNPGVLAMNLSVKQLEHHDFIETFKRLMYAIGVKPEWIELEITESQLMRKPEDAIKVLQELSDLGVSLSVDDFGTGYSSFAYLKKLPISKLKIDKEFIQDIPKDEEDIAITKAIIVLAKSLNLKVLAEGVETRDQKEFLLREGCRFVQGYYYSKPVNVEQMEKMIIEGVEE
ncbi:MAG: EAL domain-containing protein [Campylobacterales bacterium]|nr:EAL domain-containing protein [Campylobacterales bacterium]